MRPETDRDRPASTRAHRARAEVVQRRRFILVVCLLAVLVVVTAVLSRSCREEDTAASDSPGSTGTSLTSATSLASATYAAELTTAVAGSTAGAPAGAVLTLAYDSDTETLGYRLEITAPLANPSVAAICQGSPGENGTTVFTLFPGPTVVGDFSGVLAEGTVATEDFVGPLETGTIGDLIGLIQSGGAYATVGTRECPIDAVRGQIR